MEYFVHFIFNNRYSCCRCSQKSFYDSTNNIVLLIISITATHIRALLALATVNHKTNMYELLGNA